MSYEVGLNMQKANKIVMFIGGSMLIIASILKCHQLLTEPILSRGFWESWEFFLIQIPLELGLGIWLVCGLFRKAAWLLGLIAFGGFIGVTLQKALAGAASCGCFGTVHVNPWITFAMIDIPLFLAFAIFRPKGEKLLPPPWPRLKHFLAIAIPTFILLPTLEYILITNKPAPVSDKYEVLDIGQWSSQPEWPLLQHIDIKDQIQAGEWVVIMYHYDCPTCAKAVPQYEQYDKSLQGNEGMPKFAFIEMPPYGSEKQKLLKPESQVVKGRLSDVRRWLVETPVVVVLRDGKVLQAWQANAPELDEILDSIL